MNILLIIPYFGVLPSYFPAFLTSLKYWKKGDIDIAFITDDISIQEMTIPECMSIYHMSLSELKKIILDRTGYELCHPYKLCDFRPLYATIFSDICKGYQYWGYCDIDTIMGDMIGYLQSINYQEYDRIGRYGHFTLYKNKEVINNLWRHNNNKWMDNDTIFSTTYPCNFDEIGMNQICIDNGISFYSDVNAINIATCLSLSFHDYRFINKNDCYQIITWQKGKLLVYEKEDSTRMVEFAYTHFMGRKSLPVMFDLEGDSFIITHQGFSPFKNEDIGLFFKKYGRCDSKEERILFQKQQAQLQRDSRFKKVIKEIKYRGIIPSFVFLYKRWRYIQHLN